MADARSTYQESTYKGVQFAVTSVTNTSGHRLAIHEFPQHNKPYVENLGEKYRKIQVEAFVSGATWKQNRADLEEALRGDKGVFVHPIVGNVLVECESFTVIDRVIEKQRYAEFQIEFVEVGEQPTFIQISTISALQDTASIGILKLGSIFTALYKISRLPQTLLDELSDHFSTLTGISGPYQLLNGVNEIKSLINGGFTIPWQVPVLLSAYTSAINFDYSDKGTKLNYNENFSINGDFPKNQTNSYNPRTAHATLLEYIDIKLPDKISNNSIARTQFNDASSRIELLFKSFIIGEAIVAVSQIDFDSTTDAQNIWNNTLLKMDKVIDIAVNLFDDDSYVVLTDMRTKFINDIQNRSPYLNSVTHLSITTPTPALVIAYEQYEDVSREDDIIKRNKIIHPGFVLSNQLEVLSK